MDPPVAPNWQLDRCTNCGVTGDRRLMTDEECRSHVAVNHVVVLDNTRRISKIGPFRHRGHLFPGDFFTPANYHECKHGRDTPACWCEHCNRTMQGHDCCGMEESGGRLYCSTCGTYGNDGLPPSGDCPTRCARCGLMANKPRTVIPGTVHNWVQIEP